MTHISRTAAPALAAIAVALSLCGTARAQTAQPGVTDDTVKIGVTGPLTGPVAAIGAVSEGIRTRVDAVNASGGVRMGDGKTRKIQLVVEDDALDPQRTLANVRKMVGRDEVFAVVGTAATPNNQAIGRYMSQTGIPNVFMYSGVHELSGPEWEIGIVPAFAIEAQAFAKYLKDTKPGAKVGILYLNTETGQLFTRAFERSIQGGGVTIVERQPTTNADPTIETQLSKLKASGADTLVVITAPRQGAQAVRFAAESGWNPVTLVSNIASSVSSLTPAGLENAKGVVTTSYLKQVTSEEPTGDAGINQYLADRKAAKPKFSVGDTIGQTGYLIGDALVRSLEATREPTRQSFMNAVRNLDRVKSPLLIEGITLNTKAGSDLYPIEAVQLLRFDGKIYQPVGGLLDYEGTTKQ